MATNSVNSIFSEISAKQVEGMMFHNDMADYYDFLDLRGFKRMHEYHFLDEASEMRGIHRYFINHYNSLIPDHPINSEGYIPKAWNGQTRQSVDNEARKKAIQSCMEKWCELVRNVKKFYEEKYCQLCDLKEIAAAMKVKELIANVDDELKHADRLHIELKSLNYDMPYIFYIQDEMHEKFKDKTKDIGIDIC